MARHTKKHAKASMPNRVREVLLSLGALAGLVSIIIFIAGLAFGITPLIFRSGSMSPTIDTGALAFARTVPASEVLVGDIVSVSDSQGTRITHRVESIDQQGNNLAVAQLRGDANPIADPDPYVITEADRVFFSINRLGYVAVWLSGPSGLVLGAITVGGLLYIAFRPRKRPDEGEPSLDRQDAHGDSHAFKAIVALATVGLTVVGASQIGGTKAGYTDTATATSIQFGTAATFPTSPSTASCAVNFALVVPVAVTITWPATVGSSYRLIARDSNGSLLGSNDYTATSTTGSMRYGSGGTTVAFPLIVGTYNIEIHGLSGTSVTPSYSGYQFSILVGLLYSCGGPISGTSALSRSAAPALAADAPSTPTTAVTSTAVTSTTASSTTPTTTLAPAVTTTSTTAPSTTTSTTAPSTTTSSPATTTAPQTTTATTTTTTTTVPPTTTTPSEVPVDAPVTTTGHSAQKLSTSTGTVVSVSNSSGTEVYRGTVDSDAVLHWLTGTDQLYVITPSGVTVIDTSTGVWAESPAPSELPDEIKALVP
ncbi:signal peptidase I [Rhodococcus qingshengii]|uniref:signal peptidase I n=1 Tax=Rhodococcus qingshengii TaxID=334542 RepID=UPI0022B49C55|nr:signal peptidase I [Rhodococcus qingshengii]MCZ4547106.1 signal peptidase I [Rhodococcus qingshengii]